MRGEVERGGLEGVEGRWVLFGKILWDENQLGGCNIRGRGGQSEQTKQEKNIFSENKDMWVGLKKKCLGKDVIMIQ